eukprot:1961713-Pleurochrysis_carterae.AAC.1
MRDQPAPQRPPSPRDPEGRTRYAVNLHKLWSNYCARNAFPPPVPPPTVANALASGLFDDEPEDNAPAYHELYFEQRAEDTFGVSRHGWLLDVQQRRAYDG